MAKKKTTKELVDTLANLVETAPVATGNVDCANIEAQKDEQIALLDERVKELAADVAQLKRANAGLRGENTKKVAIIKRLEEVTNGLRQECKDYQEMYNACHAEMMAYKGIVELPWYKRLFKRNVRV